MATIIQFPIRECETLCRKLGRFVLAASLMAMVPCAESAEKKFPRGPIFCRNTEPPEKKSRRSTGPAANGLHLSHFCPLFVVSTLFLSIFGMRCKVLCPLRFGACAYDVLWCDTWVETQRGDDRTLSSMRLMPSSSKESQLR